MKQDIIWKGIPDYPNYEVSNKGKVRRLKGLSCRETRNLKLRPNGKGYLRVSLSRESKTKDFYVHRLVAILFLDNPLNKPEVNHKNKNKSDNTPENLEWTTSQENNEHAFCDKLFEMISPEGEIVAVNNMRRHCRENGLSTSCIYRLFNNTQKQHKGWKLNGKKNY